MPLFKMQQHSSGWGGRRKGAGRPKQAQRKGPVPHRARAATDESRAVHVAMRMAGHVISLRSQRSFRVIDKAFRAWQERDGFRLLHFSVMGNHLHLLVEADSGRALSRAIQGISLRIAKGLNRLMARRGRVFAGRYFSRVLHTAREVRTVLAYVLNNARHHRLKKNVKKNWVDEYSSAHAFDGWTIAVQSRALDPPPIVAGQSAIVKRWHRAGGPIAPNFVPGAKEGVALHPAVA